MEEITIVLVSGSDHAPHPRFHSTFKKHGISFTRKRQIEVDVHEQGIYLCDFVPETPKLLNKLLLLSRNGSPVISLYDIIELKKHKQYDFILYLPRRTSPTVLTQIIKWLSTQGKSSDVFRSVYDQLETRKREMVRELALASELQKSILPKSFPTDVPFNFTHKYVPHKYIGGDFFDVIRISDTKIGVLIADASGHGTAAAFVIAMFKSILNHHAPGEPSPAKTLSKINDELYTIIQDHFITAFYAVIDTKTLEGKYCSAGHPKQILITRDRGLVDFDPNSFLIGMFDNIEFEDSPISLSAGDRLFCYTDGIVEVTDDEGAPFGFERLEKTIEMNLDKTISQISNEVLSQIITFMKGTTFPDDITIFIIEVIEEFEPIQT